MIQNNAAADGKKPVLVAIYTRKSNDENLTGAVTSIGNQQAACRAYINIQKEKGWQEYPEEFDDPAESGKSLKRPAMKRLLRAVEEDRVQVVTVYKLDRMTRNSKDFHSLLELFEKHNVAFVSATESIDTKSPQGRLMTAIMVQFAQYDREMDVERSKDFHLARARKGLWCAGLPPLGYDLKDKLLVLNEGEASLVRRIFDLYLERQSALTVAQELDSLGFRRKTYKTLEGKPFGGKPFDPDSVVRILQRKVYIGLITNDRTKQEFPGQQTPIVLPAVFERAQELLKSHVRRQGHVSERANKYGFRLKGLTRCGECQNAVVPYVRPKAKTGKVYLYYKCLSKQNGMPVRCSVTSIGAQKLEEFVIEKLAAVGWDRPLLERVVEKVKTLSSEQIGPMEREKKELDGQLGAVCREIRNIIGLSKDQGASQELAREMEKLEATRKTLEARLHELAVQISYRKRAVYDVDAIQGLLQHFARFIYKLPIERQIQVIRLLVSRVLLFKDRVRVELHELPIPDIQRALDIRPGPGSEVQIPPTSKVRGQNHRTAVVEVRQNWRARWGRNLTAYIESFVPAAENTQYNAPFSVAWPLAMGRILNGEKVIQESLSRPDLPRSEPPEPGVAVVSISPAAMGTNGHGGA